MPMKLGADMRGYLDVNILGVTVTGLLDSGAARTLVNAQGWVALKAAGLALESCKFSHVQVADKGLVEIAGEIQVPFRVGNTCRVVPVICVPLLNTKLILGIDFWRRYHLRPDFLLSQVEIACSQVDLLEKPPEIDEDPLTPGQRAQLQTVLDFYKPDLDPGRLGCVKGAEHHIDVGDASPFKFSYYNLNPKIMSDVHAELDRRLKEDIVEPSTSPFQSPLLIIPKKNNSFRWVVDLRKLNSLIKTPSTSYPLPRINPLLSKMQGASIISTIDISDAYLQIKLSEESRAKTAFYVPGRGLYQFKRMPAGLKDAASRWQQTIDAVLREVTESDPNVVCYMDDIMLWSPAGDWEHHLALVKKVCAALVKAGITVNLQKSSFGRKMVKYLGHIIDSYGTRPDPEKISAVVNFPVPKTIRHLRQFLGLTGWVRKYVPSYASIAKPLNDRNKKNQSFVWGPEEEVAFVKLKELLCSYPVLRSPDFSRRFKVYTDASALGTGAILCQDFDDGEHVIAYSSKSLRGKEPFYSATELECLGVVHALLAFRPYLEGYQFDVITDHHALLWLYKLKNPSGRLARWAMSTQQFDFNIIHRKGSKMQAPDALSRNPEELQCSIIEIPQSTDAWYLDMLQRVEAEPDAYSKFAVKDGLLLKLVTVGFNEPLQWVQLLPAERREEAMYSCHDEPTSGHGGFFKTFDRVRRKAYWPGMREDVRSYVAKCHTCQQVKIDRRRPPGLMGSAKVISAPFEVISTDLVGPLPRSKAGCTYLSVVTCAFSKYVSLRPLRTATTKTVLKHLKDVIMSHGAPRMLICDNGAQYIAAQFKKFCKKYHIKIRYNIPYNPRSNPTERTNQTVETIICAYIQDDHREWDLHLPEIQCAVNTSASHVTGLSPHMVVFGSDFVLDGRDHALDADVEELEALDPQVDVEEQERREDVLAGIRAKLADAKRRNASRYNLRRRDDALKAGDMVWRRNFVKSKKAKGISKKLCKKWIGPLRVKERLGRVSYMLEDAAGKNDGPWHIEQLKRCVS